MTTVLLLLLSLVLAEELPETDGPPIVELLEKTDVVVIGKVGKDEMIDTAKDEPGRILLNSIEIEKCLKGDVKGKISFTYVGYNPERKILYLNEGKRYILFLKSKGMDTKAEYSLVDSDYGALLAGEKLVGKVKAALESQAKKPKHEQPKGEVKAERRYAIVVADSFFEEKGGKAIKWKSVITELKKKYKAKVFRFSGLPDANEELKKTLGVYRPQYVCFVSKPQHCVHKYVRSVIRFMRALDDDPYDDAVWAILTGYNADDALNIIKAKPLQVKFHLSHVGSGWLKWFEEGISFSEGVKGEKWLKKPGESPKKVKGPDDTTEQWVGEVNKNKVDIISTSGHATQVSWSMGYRYKNGKIAPAGNGVLKGIASTGRSYRIKTSNPKIYYSPGNCLIANIPAKRRNCMCLSWIHNGCYQFFGHIEPQIRTCTAWGIASYFFALQDSYTFSQAVYANRIASRYKMENHQTGREKRGCNRCLEITVLYGDPAWDARMKRSTEPIYEMDLKAEKVEPERIEITFSLAFKHDCTFDARYLKPPVAILPYSISDWKVKSSDATKTIVADNFIMLDLTGKKYLKGDKTSATITCRLLKPGH